MKLAFVISIVLWALIIWGSCSAFAVCRVGRDDHLYRCGGTARGPDPNAPGPPPKGKKLTPEQQKKTLEVLLRAILGSKLPVCHKYDWECIEESDRREAENALETMRGLYDMYRMNKEPEK